MNVTFQRLSENAAKLAGDEDVLGPLSRPILRELQAVMQRCAHKRFNMLNSFG